MPNGALLDFDANNLTEDLRVTRGSERGKEGPPETAGVRAAATRLSVKALRRYDEIGLLTPARVDPSSGYRYHELGQANRAEAVRILRSVDMPLDEIRAVLDEDDPELVHKRLLVHRDRLADRLATQERTLAYLETLIQRKEGVMPYDGEVAEVPPQLVAATTMHTNLSRIGDDIGAGFGALMMTMGREGVAPSGLPLIVYPDIIDDETGGDLATCVPIAVDFTGNADVYRREREGGTMATTVHHGPYERIAAAYHTLTGWISEHGHDIAGPPRETYLNDPQTVVPEALLTRVEFPICSEGG